MIWAQIRNDITTAIPPDGTTAVDVYAIFRFGGDPLPDGAKVSFLIGTGNITGAEQSVDEVSALVFPVDGISLVAASATVGRHVVRSANGELEVLSVAKTSINPIPDFFRGNISIVAYTSFDRLGTEVRFAAQQVALFVAEGEGLFLGSVEKYDPVGDSWSIVAEMPTARAGAFSGTVSGKIYVMGGFAAEFLAATEEYDPAGDSWISREPMSVARGFGAAVTAGGKIYCIGGYNFLPGRASSSLDVYDPSTDIWTELASMPIPLAFHVAEAIGGTIYVMFGGSRFDDKDIPISLNSGIMAYDISGDSWSFVGALYGTGNGTAASTALSAAVATGSTTLSVPTSAQISPVGFLTLSPGLGNEETVAYSSFVSGQVLLVSPAEQSHSSGATVRQASLPREKLGASSYVNGTRIVVVGGLDPAENAPTAEMEDFNTSTLTSSILSTETLLARHKASGASLGTHSYVASGSAEKSDFVRDFEKIVSASGVSSSATRPSTFRTSAVLAQDGTSLFLIGGQGSGHDAGWLSISVEANPLQLRADGKSSASVSVLAVDAGGDSPADGTSVKLRGLVFIPGSQVGSNGGAIPSISILPVLFSANEVSLTDGEAYSTLLPRSEDPINEVIRLADFVKGDEELLNQEQLKQHASALKAMEYVMGDSRALYSIAIEAFVDTGGYSGRSNSAAAISGAELAGSSKYFNPPGTDAGLSATVNMFSDIVSIPDVILETDDPVDGDEAIDILEEIRSEIPFGASPHFDAITIGAQRRISDDVSPPTDVMITASDNEDSGSASTAAEAADEANAVHGEMLLPVFVNTFVVTDPISLSARKSRTDVVGLETISSETGGESFSVVSPDYIDFVIGRIKTSAPSSIGSGSVEVEHAVSGSIYAIFYEVTNLVAGNSAEIDFSYSTDGYNFVSLDEEIKPNEELVLPIPIPAESFRYKVFLRSSSFDSPILRSVRIKYVEPNVQYIFAFPVTASNQASELAAVVNMRAPDGVVAEIGASHGSSTMFDRDFSSIAQPALADGGIIVPVNRDDEAVLDGVLRLEALDSADFFLYRAKSGPWAWDATVRVFVDEQEASASDYFLFPENGAVVFSKRQAASKSVTMQVQNQPSLRVGIRVTNPTLDEGKLDSFAFMFGTTDQDDPLRPAKPPFVKDLAVLPQPAFPSGPLTASYTFVSPAGRDEDESSTRILWFRNGAPVPELTNKTEVSNADLLANKGSGTSKIEKGQKWSFSVRPSDGTLFGTAVVSPQVSIANTPPIAENMRLRSTNLDPSKLTSSDTVFVDYDYSDDDGDESAGDIVTWYVNGILLKSGTEKSISPDELDASGINALKAGNSVRADVTPYDGSDYGTILIGLPAVIDGTPPSVTDVSLAPPSPTVASNLRLTFAFSDKDAGVNQSAVAWFRDGTRVPELDNSVVVPAVKLGPKQKWYAVVTPNNGIAEGAPEKSNEVVVK